MKLNCVLLNALSVFAIFSTGLLLSNILFADEVLKIGSDTSKAGQQQALSKQVDAIESYINDIMQTISGQSQPTDLPLHNSIQTTTPKEHTSSDTKLIEKRMEAANKSLSNISVYLATKMKKMDSPKAVLTGITGPNDENCHWVRECVFITCCRWGPAPENPGTNSCLDQCCRTWENRLVCN